MTNDKMRLGEAIGMLADLHETEAKRIQAWADEIAPTMAAELGIPLDRLRPVLEAHLAQHLSTLGEIAHLEAAELVASAKG